MATLQKNELELIRLKAQKVVFDAYQEKHPALMDSISTLLAMGEPIETIERKALEVSGDRCFAAEVRLCGEYLARIG